MDVAIAATDGEQSRQALLSTANAQPLPEVDIRTARIILDDYDGLKESQRRLRALLKVTIKEMVSVGELTERQHLYEQHCTLATQIVDSRTNYLSFDVISPDLARADQLIYVSRMSKGGLGGHDEDILRHAALVVGRVCRQDSLFGADERVREQFLHTFRDMKRVAAATELEDLKMLQTLADTLSDEKKGPGAWWDIHN